MARPQAKDAASAPEKHLSRRVLVNIKRDQTATTPRVIWMHEFPILEEIFGEGNVEEIDPSKLDEGYSSKPSPELLVHNKAQDPIKPPSENMHLGWVFVGNPETEYERLGMVYGRHAEVPVSNCQHVFGRFQERRFSVILGRPKLQDLPDEQLRDLVKAWGFQIPQVDTKTSAEDRKAAEEARAQFNAMTTDQLIELAESLGVEIGV